MFARSMHGQVVQLPWFRLEEMEAHQDKVTQDSLLT